MKTIVALLALAATPITALAQSAPPKIPTGYEVKGMTDYVMVGTRVVQIDCNAAAVRADRRFDTACGRTFPGGNPIEATTSEPAN